MQVLDRTLVHNRSRGRITLEAVCGRQRDAMRRNNEVDTGERMV